MTADWLFDDDQLAAELACAIRSAGPIPDLVITAARAAIEFRTLDDELARLTYDSADNAELAATFRSATASVRSFAFECGHRILELDVVADSIVGLLRPAVEGEIVIETPADVLGCGSIGASGMFCVAVAPSGLVRFRVDASECATLTTEWVRL
jgi:hypothetical protein